MSKRSKSIRRDKSAKPAAPAVPRRPNAVGGYLLAALVVLAAGGGIWWWRTQPTALAGASAASTEPQATNSPPNAAGRVVRPEFQKLKGKWERLDGGYVIEIKDVDAEGKLDAAYFNPKPIHVARAQAAMDGATLKAFIELRDVNYPGSTYTLVYGPSSDQLTGIYYQALQQQSFDVTFIRLK